MSQQQKPSRVLELGSTRDFDDQLLSSVTLWSAEARDLRHWRTGLEFAGKRPTVSGIAGISIDMIQPITHEYHDPHRDGAENLYGSLQMSPRDKSTLYSKRKGLFSCPLPFKKKALAKVKDVVGLILEQGRQYYKFNPAGSGCLYWHFELLEAFVERGWIERESLHTAHTRVSGLACRNVGTIPYPPVQGTFYRLDEVWGVILLFVVEG